MYLPENMAKDEILVWDAVSEFTNFHYNPLTSNYVKMRVGLAIRRYSENKNASELHRTVFHVWYRTYLNI